MRIRNRLTLQSTLIIAIILALFGAAIFYTYANFREEEFFERLEKRATTKVRLLIDSKLEPQDLQAIYKNAPNSLFYEEVAVYDTDFNLLYHDNVEVDFVKESKEMLDNILHNQFKRYTHKDRQVVGFLYEKDSKKYLVTAAAFDEYGLANLEKLQYIILFAFLLSIVIVFGASRFFALQALKPVSKMVDKVSEISTSNLDLRVNEGNRKDEIAELAITFNQMLDRLEQSFNAQKQFVSNISHEMRTPLATVIGELELAISRERGVDEYKKVIGLVLNDARKMAKLSNNLLNLAKASYDQAEIDYTALRIDELLIDAREDVLKGNPSYRINVAFEKEHEESAAVSIHGNEYLLKVAFSNLMENSCKFSANRTCGVIIDIRTETIVLQFEDTGIGISAEDLPFIFTPFYRGINKKYAEGSGIGLTLTEKIINRHKGKITVMSKNGTGTIFTVELPHP